MSITIQSQPTAGTTRYSREPIFVTLQSDAFSGDEPPYMPSQENLEAYLELYASGGLVTRLRAPYNYNTKQTTTDLGNLAPTVYALPDPGSILPHGSAPIWVGEAAGLVHEILFKCADKYGAPSVAEDLTDSNAFFVIEGSRSANAFRGNVLSPAADEAPFRLLHRYRAEDHATTWAKYVSYDQADWMYLYTFEAFTLRIVVTLHQADGTDTEVEITDALELESNKVYWVQCGVPQLNQIDLITSPDIYGYTVSLNKLDSPVPVSQQFYIDKTCQDWGEVMLYTNGLGGIESVHLKGKMTPSREVERVPFRRTRWTDFTVEKGDYSQLPPEGASSRSGSVGYYPIEQIRHLQQLMHAETWIIRNGSFERVQVTSSSINLPKDDSDLHSIDIAYRDAFEDDNFTR